MIASHPPARTAIIRSVLLFSPFLAIVAAAFVAIVASGVSGGAIIGMVVVGLVTLLLVYQVAQSLRDLLTNTVETEGLIERQWSRHEFFIFRNSYVFVKGNVYRLSPEQEIEVELGTLVRIRHYPHTGTVDAVEVLERGGKKEASDA